MSDVRLLPDQSLARAWEVIARPARLSERDVELICGLERGEATLIYANDPRVLALKSAAELFPTREWRVEPKGAASWIVERVR